MRGGGGGWLAGGKNEQVAGGKSARVAGVFGYVLASGGGVYGRFAVRVRGWRVRVCRLKSVSEVKL